MTSPLHSTKRDIFAKSLAMGNLPCQAAKSAGLTRSEAKRLRTDEYVQTYVGRAKVILAETVTRSEIIGGFKEAIDMARANEDPNTMIRGWRELGLIADVYAPETKRHVLSVEVEELRKQLKALSDEELFKIIEGEIDESQDTEPR